MRSSPLALHAQSSDRQPVLLTLICCVSLLILASCTKTTTPADGGVPDADFCPDPDVEGGIAIDDFCPEYAQILCTGYQGCCEIDDITNCLNRVAAECEAGEISSIRAGFSCLDGPIARRCLDTMQEAFSDCLYNDYLGRACRYQWYGHAIAGEHCRDVWHCERGLGCVLDGTDGTCIELPGEDDSCGETGVCRPGGLYCSYIDWICHPDPELGEDCEREGICAAGACVEGVCQEVPWC